MEGEEDLGISQHTSDPTINETGEVFECHSKQQELKSVSHRDLIPSYGSDSFSNHSDPSSGKSNPCSRDFTTSLEKEK